jgi:hypothetical protein
MASPSPKQLESKPFSTSHQPSLRKPKFSDSIGAVRMLREEVKAMSTWQASQRVWLLPVARPWCYVIAVQKTVQGRQLRMTQATATFFSRPWMQQRSGTGELQRGTVRHSSCNNNTRQHVCQTSRPDRQLPDPKGVCTDVRTIQVQVTTMTVCLQCDNIGAEGG